MQHAHLLSRKKLAQVRDTLQARRGCRQAVRARMWDQQPQRRAPSLFVAFATVLSARCPCHPRPLPFYCSAASSTARTACAKFDGWSHYICAHGGKSHVVRIQSICSRARRRRWYGVCAANTGTARQWLRAWVCETGCDSMQPKCLSPLRGSSASRHCRHGRRRHRLCRRPLQAPSPTVSGPPPSAPDITHAAVGSRWPQEGHDRGGGGSGDADRSVLAE